MIDTSGLIKRDEAGLPPAWVQTTLAEVVEPRTGKADPQATPEARYIGMAHVEAHRMRLLGVETAGSMKSAASVFRKGDVLYGRLRPYLNKVFQPDFGGLCSSESVVMPETSAVCGQVLKYRLNSGDFVKFSSGPNTGDRPRVDFNQESGIRLLRPGNLHVDGQVRWTTKNTRYMPKRYLESASDLRVGRGELVINLTAQSLKDDFLGRVYITSRDDLCLLNQRLARS